MSHSTENSSIIVVITMQHYRSNNNTIIQMSCILAIIQLPNKKEVCTIQKESKPKLDSHLVIRKIAVTAKPCENSSGQVETISCKVSLTSLSLAQSVPGQWLFTSNSNIVFLGYTE